MDLVLLEITKENFLCAWTQLELPRIAWNVGKRASAANVVVWQDCRYLHQAE